MVRRSFRLGLWLGLLFGVGFAVMKTVQARRTSVRETIPPGRDPWPPVARTEPVAERPAPGPAPIVPEPEPPREPEPEVEPEPSPHLEIVPAPAAALEEHTSPPPPPLVPAEPEAAALRLVPPTPAEEPVKKVAPPKQAAPPAPPAPKWVEPVSPDMCPDSHPIKAKLSSKLFHLPGMFAYARTRPDRCYDTAESAESDGLTKGKR